MYVDALLLLSDKQVLGTGATPSTNEIDFSVDRDMGKGEPMAVVISVTVAADVADADETYQFDLRTDDNAAMASAQVLITRIILGADLTEGSVHIIPLPLVNEQFIDMNYTLAGTTPSVTLSAFLLPQSMVQAYEFYASGFTIQ